MTQIISVGRRKFFVLSIILFAILVAILGTHTLFVSASDFTGANEEFVTYSRLGSDYTFRHPGSWHIYGGQNMPYMRIENIDAGLLNTLPQSTVDQYFKIEIVTLPSDGLSLRGWVQRQNTTSQPLPKVLEQQDVEVAGQVALYQLEQFGSLVHPVVFMQKGEKIYLINFSRKYTQFKTVIDNFLANFELAS